MIIDKDTVNKIAHLARLELAEDETEKMIADMKAMDTRLDEKLAAMNASKGDQKVEAMAAVIKEMVSQRKEMQEHMMKMHDMGKGHMMEHMKPGMEGEAGKKKDM